MSDGNWPVIRNLEDIRALESVPWKERLESATVVETILANAARHPDRAAIKFLPTGGIDETPDVTRYQDLARGIRQSANLLQSLGIGRKDVVSLLVPPLPQSHLAIWGGSTAGIVSPVNFLMEADAIAGIVAESGATALIAYDDRDGYGIWDKVQAIRGRLPQLKTIIRISPHGETPTPEDGVLEFNVAIAGRNGGGFDFDPAIKGTDTAFLIHTGGTTGAPKLTRITHDNILFKTWATPAMQGLRGEETIFGAAPLYHVGGIEPSSAVPLGLGMTLVIPGPRGLRNKALIDNYWHYFARFGITRLYGVPTSYMATANVPIGDADLSGLRSRIAVGSAPLPAELAKRYEALVGVKMANIYGLTEGTAAIAVAPPDGEIKYGSCGLRYPYVDLRIVRKAGDGSYEDCPAGESGEIVVKGPNVTPGYQVPDHNKGLFTPDGYLITGDVGRFDEDGYLWITGRSKDIIVRGGHNIDPQLTEEALYRHPAVEVAGAVAMPDAYAGELPVAFVGLKSGQIATAAELKDYAREHVTERAAAPAEVFVLDQVPLTAIGKVDKVELRKKAALWHFAPKVREALGGKAHSLAAEDRPGRGMVITVKLQQGDPGDARSALAALFGNYSIGWEIL